MCVYGTRGRRVVVITALMSVSEMVSMVMVAITTVLNYNTSNRNGFS